MNKLKLDTLVGNTYSYVMGSGHNTRTDPNDKEYVVGRLAKIIEHELFDSEFYYNYLGSPQKRQYKDVFEKEVLKPMLKNIDKTLQLFFELEMKNSRGYVQWKHSHDKTVEMIDTFFRKNSKIPNDIKKAYYDYRLDYAGVKLK
jgi:hypothetical protein